MGAHGEDDIVGVPLDRRQVGQLAVVTLHVGNVVKLELLGGVRVPVAAKGLKVDDRDGLGAEHRPHRHLDGARVRRGHDADQVVRGQANRLEQLARLRDGGTQLRLARLGAVRAAQRRVGEVGQRVPGPLGARARRKVGDRRPNGGHRERRIGRRGGEHTASDTLAEKRRSKTRASTRRRTTRGAASRGAACGSRARHTPSCPRSAWRLSSRCRRARCDARSKRDPREGSPT
jgi:hypothetical protein